MRKLVVYTLLSLDGVAESPDRYVLDWDDRMDENLAAVIGTQDAVLLGRGSYDEWATYWPTSDVQPFADFINSVPKYVFTSTQPPVAWPGTTVVTGPADKFVRDLKDQPGGDIGLHGSITLAHGLIAAGLVDELRLVISPTLVGSGRKLFVDDELRRLKLTEVEGTSSGTLLVTYALS